MHTAVRGFTFIEVLVYLGLLSLLIVAFLRFSGDMLSLNRQGSSERVLGQEMRLVSEDIVYRIRNSAGVDRSASVLDSDDGKLVLKQAGTSDTVTIERQDGQVVYKESGHEAVPLQSGEIYTGVLRFTLSRSEDPQVEYVGVALSMWDKMFVQRVDPKRSSVSAQMKTGAMIRTTAL